MRVVGLNGPEVVVSGALADLLEPQALAWAAQVESNGASREVVSVVRQFADGVQFAAASFRASLSADGSVIGTSGAVGADGVDADSMTGVSTAVAADRLGLCQRRVTGLCREGRLVGRKVGRSWLVCPDSIDAYKEAHP